MNEHMMRWGLNDQWDMCINAYADDRPTDMLKNADDVINKHAIPTKK